MQGKIISLCYIISLFLYLLRVRFGSRVWLKPREKQVPAAPKSLKANVDKPQLKYKAVWRENVHNGIQRKFLLKRFCLRPLSILYFILHFSVNKAFFTFITLKFLSKKKILWFNVVHTCYPLNIPATSYTFKKLIFYRKVFTA